MLLTLKNNQIALVRKLEAKDHDLLVAYYQALSTETKKRFAPHAFDSEAINAFYQGTSHHGYIVQLPENLTVIAYAIIKIGYLEHDSPRLASYYLKLDSTTDSTFAPSVSDEWQSSGLGSSLFQFICNDLEEMGIKRIILWGGVQKDNAIAIHFYQKNGFRILGQFVYQGENYDMINYR